MRGVWRQVKKEKPPFLPNRSQFFHLMIAMNRCIIQHHKGILTHLKGERIKKFDNFIRSNTVGCRKTFVIIFAVNHTKYIHSCTVLRCNVYILTGKLPTVGNIPFGTNMTFVGVIQINTTFSLLCFKFFQASHTCTDTAAARVFSLGVFLFGVNSNFFFFPIIIIL